MTGARSPVRWCDENPGFVGPWEGGRAGTRGRGGSGLPQDGLRPRTSSWLPVPRLKAPVSPIRRGRMTRDADLIQRPRPTVDAGQLPDRTPLSRICWWRTPDVSTFIFRCPNRPCVVVLLAASPSLPSWSPMPQTLHDSFLRFAAAGRSSGARRFFLFLNG